MRKKPNSQQFFVEKTFQKYVKKYDKAFQKLAEWNSDPQPRIEGLSLPQRRNEPC